MLLRDQIKALALELSIGETIQVYCPVCKATHENKLSITRTDTGLVYRCYRASCNAKGFISSLAGAYYEANKLKQKTHAYPDRDALVTLDSIYNKYNIYNNNIYKYNNIYNIIYIYNIYKYNIINNNILYNTNRNTIVFPITNILGYHLGYVDRDFSGKRHPKSISYPEINTEPFIYFPYRKELSSVCVVVEDTLSAIRCAEYCSSVALLGTHMSHATAEILSRNFDSILICLDEDATRKAIAMYTKYNLYFRKGIQVAHLHKDPKDMSHAELAGVLT